MSAAELIGILAGIARLLLPLVAVILAAFLFLRVRIINIALDGQVALGAVVYVLLTPSYGWLPAIVGAVAVSSVIGVSLAAVCLWRKADSILVSFGLLYLSLGLASFISVAASGKPGNAPLPDGSGAGAIVMGVFLAGSVLLVVVALQEWRQLRLSKVIGEVEETSSVSLVQLSGLSAWRWIIIGAVLASILAALAGGFLVELGGSYSKTISGQRDFLALAIVVVARRSVRLCILLAVVFAVGQRLAMEATTHSELAQAAPFAMALVLLAVIGVVRRLRPRQDDGLWLPMQT